MVISLTGTAFPNSSNDIAAAARIPDLLLRGLLAFAGFAVFQIDFGDISFLIVELGPDDRFAGFQDLGTSRMRWFLEPRNCSSESFWSLR